MINPAFAPPIERAAKSRRRRIVGAPVSTEVFTPGWGSAKVTRMDVNALRTWGIAVSGALMAAALVIALRPEASAVAEMQAVAQIAQADTRAAPVGFIV